MSAFAAAYPAPQPAQSHSARGNQNQGNLGGMGQVPPHTHIYTLTLWGRRDFVGVNHGTKPFADFSMSFAASMSNTSIVFGLANWFLHQQCEAIFCRHLTHICAPPPLPSLTIRLVGLFSQSQSNLNHSGGGGSKGVTASASTASLGPSVSKSASPVAHSNVRLFPFVFSFISTHSHHYYPTFPFSIAYSPDRSFFF
jgi:hypothetical protein